MYGVGGTSEVCYEQVIPDLWIEHVQLETFQSSSDQFKSLMVSMAF